MPVKRRYFAYLAFIIVFISAFIIVPRKAAILLNQKAVEQYQQKNIDQAIDYYQQSLKIFPYAEVYYNLAVAYDEQDNTSKAVENYEKALELDPEHVQSHEALASIYRYQGRFDKAKEHIKTAKQIQGISSAGDVKSLDREKLILMCNEAIAHFENNNYQYAIRKLREVILLDNSFHAAYKYLGDIYFRLNDLYNAQTYFTKALSAGCEEAQVYASLGLINMKLEKYHQAKGYLEKACRLDPDNVDMKYSLASVLRDNKQPDEALNIYHEVLNIDPAYPNLHNDIADIYRQRGNEEAALHEFTKELTLALKTIAAGDESPQSYLRCAIAYKGLGQLEQARDTLNRILAEDPDFYHAYYVRSQVFELMGKSSLARQDLAKGRDAAIREKPMPRPETAAEYVTYGRNDPGYLFKQEDILSDTMIDTIVTLKNGQLIKGRLKIETDDKVVMDIDMGSTAGAITFSKKKIEKLEKIK